MKKLRKAIVPALREALAKKPGLEMQRRLGTRRIQSFPEYALALAKPFATIGLAKPFATFGVIAGEWGSRHA
jgi:hypothetical protein